MVRTGKVVNKTGSMLSVVFGRPEACASCEGCISKSCTQVDISGEANIGDMIDVEMPEKNIVGASAIAYMVPLAALIAGLLAGIVLQDIIGIGIDPDLFCAICGAVGLGLGLFVVYGIDRALRLRMEWQPKVLTVHKQDV